MRLDLATRQPTVERKIVAPESVFAIGAVHMTPDGRAYGDTVYTMTSDLYLLEGVR
jgi:hypothetical protein